MSKKFEILELLRASLPYSTTLGDALELAGQIDALYTFDPQAWVDEHIQEFTNPPRKIQAIKELRAASQAYQQDQWLGLKEAKDIIMEAFKTSDALQALRDKLENPPTPKLDAMMQSPDPWNDSYDLGENEDRAYAEHRERLAEKGSWFGRPGPLDEEPF